MIKNYSGYSWKQIEQIENKEDCILILPISSLEQHGIQLPLGTDDIILQKILDALIDNPSVIGDYLLLPALHYGLSPEHMDFSGTITLSPKTLISVIEDIIQSIKKHGFNKICLFSSHGGNTGILRGMAQTWKHRYGTDIYSIDLWSGVFEKAASIIKTPITSDIHAGEIETSLLMYFGQTVISEEEIAKIKDYINPIPHNLNSWTSIQLSKSGAIGGVSFSSSETGKKLYDFLIREAAAQLNLIC